jgi:hypothetical protein
MSKLYLTRYLYFLEEVKLSLLDCLLKKNSLKECYFWFSEIYYSGFKKESIQLLLKIYYDFYCISNPNLLKKIKIYIKLSINNDCITSLCSIINLFYTSENCPYIFMIRTTPIRGKKNVKDISKTLLNHLKKNNCLKAHYYLKIFHDKNFNSCVELLEKFTEKKFIDNPYYEDKLHLLLAFSSKIYNIDNKINKLISRKKNDDFVKKMNKASSQIYKTLKEKRKYHVSSDIGCFLLGTNENNFDKYKCLTNEWEYYCKDTPIWKSRYEKYNIKFKDKNIKFNNDDDFDNFYDKYGYDPDEYLLNIAILIKDNTIENWLNSIYNTSFENIYKDKIKF